MLEISNHAKERLWERYNIISDRNLPCILDNPDSFITLDIGKDLKMIREIKIKGKILQYVVKDNTVLTFLPVTFEQNESGRVYDIETENHKLRLANRELGRHIKAQININTGLKKSERNTREQFITSSIFKCLPFLFKHRRKYRNGKLKK